MINFTERLDKALRVASWAHEQAKQHRKDTDIPYIIHPVGVMLIAGNATDNENILIACLMHDILEDVAGSIYNETDMASDFGDKVVSIVKDVTKDDTIDSWHARSKAYLDHIEYKACDEALVVCAADKIHNLKSINTDYAQIGEKLWDRFSTKSSKDQLWWYESVFNTLSNRQTPAILLEELELEIKSLKNLLSKI